MRSQQLHSAASSSESY